MTLKLSVYDGGKLTRTCDACGKPLKGAKFGKCDNCATKIANAVSKEFNDNIGHHMTEAILATGNEKLINQIIKGAKLIEEKKDDKQG